MLGKNKNLTPISGERLSNLALCRYIRGQREVMFNWRLNGTQIVGGRFAAAAIGNHVERDLLTFVQGAQARAFHCTDMDEDVATASVRAILSAANAAVAAES